MKRQGRQQHSFFPRQAAVFKEVWFVSLHPWQALSYRFFPYGNYTSSPEFLEQFLWKISPFTRITGGNAGPEHPFCHQHKDIPHKPLRASLHPISKRSSNKITSAFLPRAHLQRAEGPRPRDTESPIPDSSWSPVRFLLALLWQVLRSQQAPQPHQLQQSLITRWTLMPSDIRRIYICISAVAGSVCPKQRQIQLTD